MEQSRYWSLIFTISLVEISIDASPPCPYSIAGSPSGNLAIPRSRLQKSSSRTIKALQTEGRREYLNNEFRKYLVGAGIQHIVSPPYTPTLNGLAERVNRTIMESARCLLLDLQSTHQLWGYAVLTAAHIHNRLPSRATITPPRWSSGLAEPPL